MINQQVKNPIGAITCIISYIDIFPLEGRFYPYLNVIEALPADQFSLKKQFQITFTFYPNEHSF